MFYVSYISPTTRANAGSFAKKDDAIACLKENFQNHYPFEFASEEDKVNSVLTEENAILYTKEGKLEWKIIER